MVDPEPYALVPTLDDSAIWELEEIRSIGKLYLLALARERDIDVARRRAGIPTDEVRVLEAWLIAEGLVRRVSHAELVTPLAA